MENTLYLPIKQIYFDPIVSGQKKEEYREIKSTTQFRYLLSKDKVLLYDMTLITCPSFQGQCDDYNNGVYPFLPIRYEYLNLAVGYAKVRDTMLIRVSDITFEPHTVLGNKYAFWVIVYHLGEIVELFRK